MDQDIPISEDWSHYGWVIFFATLSTLLIYYCDKRPPYTLDEMPNPKSGSFMKGYKKPNLPKKTKQQLLDLEPRDEKLPLYSLQELDEHKGGNQKPWVCLKGVIYDVSANEVYDQKGGYNLFSGRDASYALATMLFDKVTDRNWRNCNVEQLECLDEWIYYYKDRYKVVGYLQDEYE